MTKKKQVTTKKKQPLKKVKKKTSKKITKKVIKEMPDKKPYIPKPKPQKPMDKLTLRMRVCDFCPKRVLKVTTCIVLTVTDDGWVQNGYCCLKCFKSISGKLKPLPPVEKKKV